VQDDSNVDLGNASFDRDVSVRRFRDGEWSALVTGNWDVGGNPNGGYLMAIVLNAMTKHCGLQDPLSVTAHFLASPEKGPALVKTEIVRRGRLATTMEGSLKQADRTCVRVIAALGDLDNLDGPSFTDFELPEMPHPDLCTPMLGMPGPNGGAPSEISRQLDRRFSPAIGWPQGQLGHQARLDGWVRFANGRDPDVTSLPLLADGFPPAVLDLIRAKWVPTVEMTLHVRSRPEPGWLRCSFRTRSLVNGTLEEDGAIFDETNKLVALTRQLAFVIGPEL
jgi:hypothetical protein